MPKLTFQHRVTVDTETRAVVYLNRKIIYLGKWGSTESTIAYQRLMARWYAERGESQILAPALPNGLDAEKISPPPPVVSARLTIAEMIRMYCKHAAAYYVKDGKKTSELNCIHAAMKFLRRRFGRLPADEFSPKKLKAVRESMITAKLARSTINDSVNRIRRMYRWAAAEELISGSIVHDLDAIEGLKAGRTKASEPAPIDPVDASVVEATLPYLSDIVADMVPVELTGMRPGEVCQLRPTDIDRTGDVWRFVPRSHKTMHHGKRRVVAIGPKAQAILNRYLLRPADAFCFSPKENERKRRREAHQSRQTPLGYGNRPGTNRRRKPKRRPGACYTSASYRRAITRGVQLANRVRAKNEQPVLPNWHPNQLRHSRATLLRRHYDVESAQVVLGHSDPRITERYAERDLLKAEAIMREIG